MKISLRGNRRESHTSKNRASEKIKFFLAGKPRLGKLDNSHFFARVVKWQTRTFEGRMPKGMGVQVPPPALPKIIANRPYRGQILHWETMNCNVDFFPTA